MLSNLLASKTGKHADVEVVVGKGRGVAFAREGVACARIKARQGKAKFIMRLLC